MFIASCGSVSSLFISSDSIILEPKKDTSLEIEELEDSEVEATKLQTMDTDKTNTSDDLKVTELPADAPENLADKDLNSQELTNKAKVDDMNEPISGSYEKYLQDKKLADAKKYVDELRKIQNMSPTAKFNAVTNCADSRVNYAQRLQRASKKYIKEFYSFRKNTSLYFSWYALEDSNFILNLIENCPDKKNKHFYAMQNMLAQNKELEKIIAINNPGGSYSKMQELFLEEYQDIFIRDPK